MLTDVGWSITGGTTSSGVYIVASNNITSVEVSDEQEHEIYMWNETKSIKTMKHGLTVHAKNYVVIYGSTYQEAMNTLMKMWEEEANAV